jgi:hypothetical protein
MKTKNLLLIGGIINALFVLFPKTNAFIFSMCPLVGALYVYLMFAKPAE